MRKSKIAILIIILALTITIPIRIHASTPETLIEQAETELIETLGTLDNVNWALDDTSLESITTQLNNALKHLEEAKQQASEGRIMDASNSAEAALSLINEAKSKAESIEKASSQTALQIQVLSWVLVPVASLFTALTLTQGYEWYLKRERRKLLSMSITKKEKKKDV